MELKFATFMTAHLENKCPLKVLSIMCQLIENNTDIMFNYWCPVGFKQQNPDLKTRDIRPYKLYLIEA